MLFGQAVAQRITEDQVPAIVLNSVLQNFPKAKDLAWKKKEDNTFKVEFYKGKPWQEHELLLASNGDILKHKQKIKVDDLPPAIPAIITRSYPSYKIDEVTYVRFKAKVYYKIALENKNKSVTIYILPSGKIVDKITSS